MYTKFIILRKVLGLAGAIFIMGAGPKTLTRTKKSHDLMADKTKPTMERRPTYQHLPELDKHAILYEEHCVIENKLPGMGIGKIDPTNWPTHNKAQG